MGEAALCARRSADHGIECAAYTGTAPGTPPAGAFDSVIVGPVEQLALRIQTPQRAVVVEAEAA